MINHKNHLITEAKKYVVKLLREVLPEGYYFHNLDHTIRVGRAATFLAEQERISALEKEILILAAWFHDTGHIQQYEGHEQASEELSEGFLKEKEYPIGKRMEVLKMIKITDPGIQPSLKTEKIIKDADLFHLGSPDYFLRLRALRKEWRVLLDRTFSDKEWLVLNLDFLTNQRLLDNGIEESKVENIRNLLSYWDKRGFVKKARKDKEKDIYEILFFQREKLIEDLNWRHDLSISTFQYLENLANSNLQHKGSKEEVPVSFSLLELKNSNQFMGVLKEENTKKYETCLLYLNDIKTITLEGGFMVSYH